MGEGYSSFFLFKSLSESDSLPVMFYTAVAARVMLTLGCGQYNFVFYFGLK